MERTYDYTGLYDAIRAELLKIGGTVTLRRIVQSCRNPIRQARDGGLSWRDVAATFEKAGLGDVRYETVRAYFFQPDAKQLVARRRAAARHAARAAAMPPPPPRTWLETGASSNVEQRGQPRAIRPEPLI